jgi:hypothetical protein
MERHLNTLFWQTFNINVNGMPTGDNTANFTVNTDSGTVQTGPATARPKRALRLKPTPHRKFLATPRKSGAETDVVLETPAGMLACEMPPRKKTRHSRNKPAIPSLLFTSQDVTPPRSQRSLFLDPSATEGSVTDYHNNEPVAQFSPNCQVHQLIHANFCILTLSIKACYSFPQTST